MHSDASCFPPSGAPLYVITELFPSSYNIDLFYVILSEAREPRELRFGDESRQLVLHDAPLWRYCHRGPCHRNIEKFNFRPVISMGGEVAIPLL
jgi:hypothetical protein